MKEKWKNEKNEKKEKWKNEKKKKKRAPSLLSAIAGVTVIDMHFRSLIPRLFNHTILRTSSFCMRMRIPSWKLLGKSRCEHCQVSNFFLLPPLWLQVFLCSDTNSQCVSVTLLAFPKQAAVGSFSRSSKMFPAVQYKFHVSSCKQESRLSIPHRLGTITRWLGTWDNPELLAVSRSKESQKSFREFTLPFNSSIWAASWFTADWLSFHVEKVHLFSTVELFQLLGVIKWLIRLVEFHALRMNLWPWYTESPVCAFDPWFLQTHFGSCYRQQKLLLFFKKQSRMIFRFREFW